MKLFRIFLVLCVTSISIFCLMGLFTSVNAAAITVNSNLDTSDPTPANGVCDVDAGLAGNQCTLRAAIQTAQAVVGSDAIHFANSMDIILNSSLPTLSEEGLTIEANVGQAVRVNGQSLVSNIFRISGSSITISNVVLYGSGEGWSNIWISDDSQDVVVANNLIGDDDAAPGGCGQSNDSYGGIYISSSGTPPSLTNTPRAWVYGNIIECHTGSPGDGITLYETDHVVIGQRLSTLDGEDAPPVVSGNIIRNNHTGIVSENGTFNWVSGNAIETNTSHGIAADGGVIIGCFPLNIPETSTCRNMIRGNGEAGVYASGTNPSSVLLLKNWIGLADDGITAIPNNIGVHLHTDNAEARVISNTISGNSEDGVRIQESNGGHELWGNIIGLGADGNTAAANGSHGIALFDDAGSNAIGSTESVAGNIISGNSGYGILVSNTPTTTISNNLIGLAANGVMQRGNGYNGIYAHNSDRVVIGPTLFIEEAYGTQKISGNGEAGIYFENVNDAFIGHANDVTYNQGDGIYIYNSQYNLVSPHLVAHNEGEGIQLVGNSAFYNQIWPLAVRDNGRLPIDFGAPGLEPNDPGDTDLGPNHLTNFPEVTMTNGSVITGTACISCPIALYKAIGDPTADGGGGTFHGFINSDASGIWSVDLASVGLEFSPVSWMAFTGEIVDDNTESSPLSPVTQIGYSVYLPAITR